MCRGVFHRDRTIVRSGRVGAGIDDGCAWPGLYRRRDRSDAGQHVYAQTLENQFRQSGIMHLMVVSGGHLYWWRDCAGYACGCCLIGGRRRCWSLEYVLLALAMFPSDSVTRAFIMGLIGALTHAMGRRTQAAERPCAGRQSVLAAESECRPATDSPCLGRHWVSCRLRAAGRALSERCRTASPNDGDDRGRAVVHPADSGVDGTGVAVVSRRTCWCRRLWDWPRWRD